MNKSSLTPKPYDKLLHKALEYLTDAAERLRNGDKLALKKMDEATTLMQSYDILYGHTSQGEFSDT